MDELVVAQHRKRRRQVQKDKKGGEALTAAALSYKVSMPGECDCKGNGQRGRSSRNGPLLWAGIWAGLRLLPRNLLCLGRHDGFLGGFGDPEFHNFLGGDLDRFAGRRISSHSCLSIDSDQPSNSWQHEHAVPSAPTPSTPFSMRCAARFPASCSMFRTNGPAGPSGSW